MITENQRNNQVATKETSTKGSHPTIKKTNSYMRLTHHTPKTHDEVSETNFTKDYIEYLIFNKEYY